MIGWVVGVVIFAGASTLAALVVAGLVGPTAYRNGVAEGRRLEREQPTERPHLRVLHATPGGRS